MNSTTDRPDFATATTCDRSSLTISDRATIARVLTWDRCASVQAHEVITIAVTNGIVQVTNLATKKWGRLITTQTIHTTNKYAKRACPIFSSSASVKLTGGRAALLSVDTFKLILQLSRQQVDEDVAYVEQLEQKLEKDSNEIKIARVSKIYPLGRKIQLLKTFCPIGRDPFAQLSASDEDQEVAA